MYNIQTILYLYTYAFRGQTFSKVSLSLYCILYAHNTKLQYTIHLHDICMTVYLYLCNNHNAIWMSCMTLYTCARSLSKGKRPLNIVVTTWDLSNKAVGGLPFFLHVHVIHDENI